MKRSQSRQQRNKVGSLGELNKPFGEGLVLYDNVVVTPIRTTVKKDGPINPKQYEDKPEWGKVVAVGAGRLLDTGEVVKPVVHVGDVVFFQKYSAIKLRQESVDYIFIREEDIFYIDR